tara:strand:+ start:290 stop:772 length:483 start_codon:yes stop_codon:yes gene_type:complete
MSIRYGKPRKNKKRRDPRYFLHESENIQDSQLPDFDFGELGDMFGTAKKGFEDLLKKMPDPEMPGMPKGVKETFKKICAFEDSIINAIIAGKISKTVELLAALKVLPEHAESFRKFIEESTGKTIDEILSNYTLKKYLIKFIESGCEMVRTEQSGNNNEN